MAKFDHATIERWTAQVDAALAKRGFTREQVTVGADGWAVARLAGIMDEAYQDRDVVDAHIQTALEAILPNCVFKDKKRY